MQLLRFVMRLYASVSSYPSSPSFFSFNFIPSARSSAVTSINWKRRRIAKSIDSTLRSISFIVPMI